MINWKQAMLTIKQYYIQLGYQKLKVGDQLFWIHTLNCNLLLKTDGDAFDLEVLVSEHLHPDYDYVTTIHLEDSKFYVQSKRS